MYGLCFCDNTVDRMLLFFVNFHWALTLELGGVQMGAFYISLSNYLFESLIKDIEKNAFSSN